MHSLQELQEQFSDHLESVKFSNFPSELYDPIRYILTLGGKRLRPVLAMLAAEAMGKPGEIALGASTAIELFHNFSLIHDDIMDKAPLRRGQPTVHEKWNGDIAILSGDAMLILAYQQLESIPDEKLPAIFKVFNRTAIELCEGQQLDMNFESIDRVQEEEYLHMIQYKTSVLLGASLQIGAMLGDADAKTSNHFYQFGLKLGTSFQIIDDILDAFGDPEKFGKQVGGDILSNKKTMLLIAAQDRADQAQLASLKHWLSIQDEVNEEKVSAVKDLFQATGALAYCKSQSEYFFQEAMLELEALKKQGLKMNEIEKFALNLLQRES